MDALTPAADAAEKQISEKENTPAAASANDVASESEAKATSSSDQDTHNPEDTEKVLEAAVQEACTSTSVHEDAPEMAIVLSETETTEGNQEAEKTSIADNCDAETNKIDAPDINKTRDPDITHSEKEARSEDFEDAPGKESPESVEAQPKKSVSGEDDSTPVEMERESEEGQTEKSVSEEPISSAATVSVEEPVGVDLEKPVDVPMETEIEGAGPAKSADAEETSTPMETEADETGPEKSADGEEILTSTSAEAVDNSKDDNAMENKEDESVNEEESEKTEEQNDKESLDEETKRKDDEEHSNSDEEGGDENRENPVFVHVNTEKEDDSKGGTSTEQAQEDDDFQPQEDPIAADTLEGTPENIEDSEQGADEELCIIPDTERVISQEEKEAAAALLPAASESTESEQQTTDSNSTAAVDKDKFLISKSTDQTLHSCIQCLLPRKAKYISTTEQRTLYICDDNCLNAFKEDNPGKIVTNKVGDLRVKDLTSESETATTTSSVASNISVFIRKCAECDRKVTNDDSSLSWETMDFCNELCLSKYQKTIASNCSYCCGDVRPNCLGKYAVRFGYDIRQFCSSLCLEEYKKGLKVCSYCQKDISIGAGFLAPAGDKGQFKDFCSSNCMDKYNNMSQHKKPVVKPGVTCSVCLLEKPISVEYEHDNKMNLFCGEPCFVAFKFVNNIVPGKCDMCGRYFDFKVLEQHSIFYDDMQHSFCSKSCQNIYIIANRRIVPCSWCKVKKYNFDMIKRYNSTGQSLVMCSLNCLSLYQVSVNAVSLKKTQCDHCMKESQPMYHLTMSDATTRNFCCYNCVMAFQNKFAKKPLTLEHDGGTPVPTGAPKRSRRPKESELPALPVISSVQSLAPGPNGSVSPTPRTTRSKANAGSTTVGTNSIAGAPTTQIKHHIIIKPAPMPEMRNMMTMCKPVQFDKTTSTRQSTVDAECQTDVVETHPVIIPVPVPVYVPVPLPMFAAPYPSPTPFPLPVPVPVFIPTTRNSANGILKEIKKIQVKIPTDPFEAELLMMAEMVADDKKEEHTDSESEEEEGAAPDEGSFSPEPVDASNSFGDDMLQMALKMASELDEPAVDLEGALTANTITASQGAEGATHEESADDPPPMSQIMNRQTFKGRKRGARTKGGSPSKRGRRASQAVDAPALQQQQQQQSQPPAEPIEKPDANMCLKYTFGVNAWKQWVTTKNAELEKSSRRVKLFKPEILQLTADELNYSLCLFVKEVRKPNGAEYAPDTIYYLCLGIQQYLFENGRIDNIFCDAYYEKFTDCLDEVARKFSVLYNDSHYIVTRVEEEHLWESKQLGAHSPHVLLSTLMFFNTKHFNLTTVDEHMQLSFSHIMKHWKRNPNQPGNAKTPGSRNVLLRFYPPQSAIANNRKKKVYEQQENEENPLRCPVKLYEFYLSKCPESVKTRNDVFYLQPERSCVPDSPVWYSTMPLPREALEKMLHRVKMVKEINVALLTS